MLQDATEYTDAKASREALRAARNDLLHAQQLTERAQLACAKWCFNRTLHHCEHATDAVSVALDSAQGTLRSMGALA